VLGRHAACFRITTLSPLTLSARRRTASFRMTRLAFAQLS